MSRHLTGFWDDFARADQAPLSGRSPTGQVWIGTGASLPAIVSGRMTNVAGNTGYAMVEVPVSPSRMYGVVTTPGPGGTVVLISSSVDMSLSDMVHYFFGSTGWTLQIRESAGAFVNLAGGTFTPTLATDGTLYSWGMRISGSDLMLELPDGTEAVVTDSRLATLWGKFLTFEVAFVGAVSSTWHVCGATWPRTASPSRTPAASRAAVPSRAAA